MIIGARTDEQLADNLGAVDLLLTDTERRRLDDSSAPDLIYPYWWQAKYNDRLGPADLAVLGRYKEIEEIEIDGSAHRPLPGFGLIPGASELARDARAVGATD